jgi:hypothetical protein
MDAILAKNRNVVAASAEEARKPTEIPTEIKAFTESQRSRLRQP